MSTLSNLFARNFYYLYNIIIRYLIASDNNTYINNRNAVQVVLRTFFYNII